MSNRGFVLLDHDLLDNCNDLLTSCVFSKATINNKRNMTHIYFVISLFVKQLKT